MEPLLTIEEASKLTRLNTKTLYSYAEKKRIPHVKLGRRLLFSARELEEWVKSCTIEKEEEKG